MTSWNISASDLIYLITGVSCVWITARIVVFSPDKHIGRFKKGNADGTEKNAR